MPPLPLNGYGNNGTIDGQGQRWWKRYLQKLLNNTRGPLMQIMYSSYILISNITLRNPPFWTLHPYDYSCKDMVIEDSYISVGDDAIAIKGGWDQYGVVYGRPSKNILIRNLMVLSMVR
ncbi:putative glycoside hydrolase, family 28, pectin lyase/virulence factor [Helianthus anomalus]